MKLGILHLAALFSTSLCLAQEKITDSSNKETEALITQWVKTESLLSKEATAWQEKKAHLNLLSEVFTEQVKVLNEELEAASYDNSNFAKEKANLESSLTESQSARTSLIQFIKKTVPRVKKVSQLLPEPLAQELDPDILTLEQNIENDNVREVLRATLKILQRSEQFNRNFTYHEQELELSGKPYRAQIIYMGLSCAFFKAGDKYGMGYPNSGAWRFELRPELAQQIEKGFAVQQAKSPSALFKLPLQIKEVQP